MLIKNANLINMAGIYNEETDLRICGGKIVEIGSNLSSDGEIEVIDAKGKTVTPGFVDTRSTVGLNWQFFRFDRNDADEAEGPVTPHVRALDAVGIFDHGFDQLRHGGVTTSVTGSGNKNLIGGSSVAIKSGGEKRNTRILKNEVSFPFVMTDVPREAFGSSNKSPATKMGTAALIREALYKAKYYREEKLSGRNPAFNLKMESLMRVFDGMLVQFVAQSDDEIINSVKIAEEFGLNYVIDVAYDAFVLQDYLKDHNVKIAMGSLYGCGKGPSERERKLENAAVLNDVPFEWSLLVGHPVINGMFLQEYKDLLCKYGLDKKKCLEGFTIKAAKMAGLDDRIGSLEVGKDADLLLWSGDLFDYYSNIDLMLIDGNKFEGEQLW